MAALTSRLVARAGVTLRQNRAALAFTALWLVANAIAFRLAFGVEPGEAALVALCVHRVDGAWGRLYASFTEVAVLGALASVIVANATRRYRPEATCAALAEHARDHLVVVGFTNLGRRARDLAAAAGATAVVVEGDRATVDELVRAEEPLVLGDARDASTLAAASIERARVVVLATDDLETVAVACRAVRAVNKTCKLVARCPDDDVGDVLAKTYDARVASTSRSAARFVLARAQKAGTRRAVVMGRNNVGKRVAEALERERVAVSLVAETDDYAALKQAGVGEADLVVIADDDLGKNLVRVDRVRDLDPNVTIICRVFHDDAAEILTKKPFSCAVLSTSRLALEELADAGTFKEIGVAASRRERAKAAPAA
jgi:Trk K+ transport system NAD-binding subunit